MELDVAFLSRLQFALTIMFHYIFPPLTIGLGGIMVMTEGLFLKTGNPIYESISRFWTKIFAVNFAMGVASGIVMEFQFGTNWSTYSRFVGDVFGSALAAEGIFAFFLESGFLAVLVFGWDRVSPKMHFFSTCMVALGAVFSSIWIVVANSWQQTPAGFHLVGEGIMQRAEITNFWEVVFNPSTVDRLVHVLIGAYILGAFFVMSISAYYILKNRHLEFAQRTFIVGLLMAAVFSLAALVSGHSQARTVAHTQPAKLAAFEGLFKTEPNGSPLYLFGIPNEKEERVDYGLAIPGLLSLMVHDDFSMPVTGLDQFPPEDRPPVMIPFQSYHLMVLLGFSFILLSAYGLISLGRGTLFRQRRLLKVYVVAVIGPYLANQLGWIAAEVGRQPWVVYGLLRTNESVSKSVPAEHVLISIMLFGFIYFLLFLIWIYVLNDKIHQGPESVKAGPREPGRENWLDVAARLAGSAGDSLTAVRKSTAIPSEEAK